MKEKILNYIKEYDHVSFIELCDEIEGFSGDLVFYNLGLENLIFWDKMSQEAVNIMSELLSNQQIHISLAEDLIYLGSGGYFPSLPVATVVKKHSTIHWLPVTFSCNKPAK